MIYKKNVPVSKISWLSSYPKCSTGIINNFYEPESIEEMVEIYRMLKTKDRDILIIGHTSNIYFKPDFCADNIISTRKLNRYEINGNTAICECGVHISKFSQEQLNNGYIGFEGLIDLPGTVGSAIYGNAGCYNCLASDRLISINYLDCDGNIKLLTKAQLGLSTRSSVFKRGDVRGVILTIKYSLESGDKIKLLQIAELNRMNRISTQPGPKNNLGSIFGTNGDTTLFFKVVKLAAIMISFPEIMLHGWENKSTIIKKNFFRILRIEDMLPYVYNWNRYIWKDERSHDLFDVFLDIHSKLFKNSLLEIEIKK